MAGDTLPRNVAGRVSGGYSLRSKGHLGASGSFFFFNLILAFSLPCSQDTCHS